VNPLSLSEQPIVLIVDDDRLLTDMFQQGMTKKGFRVLEANTGASALALLSTQTVQIVVLDITLPDMTGLQVAQTLARTHPPLPVVIATGHDLDRAGLPANVADVIRKPFSLRSLAVRLHELLIPA
jgi:DNA-binding response OmpR family regulator